MSISPPALVIVFIVTATSLKHEPTHSSYSPRHQKILTSSLIDKKYEEIKKLVIGRSKTHSDIFYGHTHGSFDRHL